MSRVRDVLLVKRHTSYHRDDIVWILIRLFLLNFLARRDNRHYTLARGDSSLAFYGEALKFRRLQMLEIANVSATIDVRMSRWLALALLI